MTPPADAPTSVSLSQLALVFLRLGLIGFGGPAAHVALMEEEIVRRRQWMSHQEYLDLIGAANLIPGPNSTEVAIHVGYKVARWPGLLLAGSCFILPSAVLVLLLAACYVSYGTLPGIAGLLLGVKPVLIAVIAQALGKLAQTCLRSATLILLAALALLLVLLGIHELIVLFGAGTVLVLLRRVGSPPLTPAAPALLPLFATLSASPAPFALGPMFLIFLKIGAVLFGSGYVLLAFLRADLVERNGWLTEQQLLDAIAVGQVTPGPVSTTATFIGYLLAGYPGAFLATLGIFLPAFAFVAASLPLLHSLRTSPAARAFLDGVNVASLALMAVVTGQLARSAILDVPTALLALLSALLLFRWQVNSFCLVLGGALFGLARAFLLAYFPG